MHHRPAITINHMKEACSKIDHYFQRSLVKNLINQTAAVNRENRPKIDNRSGDALANRPDTHHLDAGFLHLASHKYPISKAPPILK